MADIYHLAKRPTDPDTIVCRTENPTWILFGCPVCRGALCREPGDTPHSPPNYTCTMCGRSYLAVRQTDLVVS